MARLTITEEGPGGAHALLDRAQRAADASDRWFLTAASQLNQVGRWARGEAQLACDAARAAWATTRRITLPAVPQRAPRPHTPGFAGIDVVSAVENEARSVARPLPANAGRLPRVRVLLRVLGRVVSEYETRGYEGLQADERFWNLIGLLERTRVDAESETTDQGET